MNAKRKRLDDCVKIATVSKPVIVGDKISKKKAKKYMKSMGKMKTNSFHILGKGDKLEFVEPNELPEMNDLNIRALIRYVVVFISLMFAPILFDMVIKLNNLPVASFILNLYGGLCVFLWFLLRDKPFESEAMEVVKTREEFLKEDTGDPSGNLIDYSNFYSPIDDKYGKSREECTKVVREKMSGRWLEPSPKRWIYKKERKIKQKRKFRRCEYCGQRLKSKVEDCLYCGAYINGAREIS